MYDILRRNTHVAPEAKEHDKLRRENSRKNALIRELQRDNADMEDALKAMSSKVEKHSFNELLNRVGLSKSRITQNDRSFDNEDYDYRKSPDVDQHRKSVSKSIEKICDLTIGSRKTSLERKNPKAELKDIMRDKLKEHRDQSRSKSIERGQDKYA